MARPPDREIFERLIAFDSVSDRGNLPLVDWVSDLLDRRGARIERLCTPEGDKATLLIEIGPSTGEGRGGLVLSGHTDVVPATEPGWSSDPFRLAERDGVLVGRGAADMKGFLALAIGCAMDVDPDRLTHPLALLFTHDEEIGSLGARRFVETFEAPERLPRRTIVGEPTGLAVVRAHKGHLRIRIEVTGETAHSAYPRLGTNAIEPAAAVVLALGRLRGELESERPAEADAFPEVPFVTLNVGRIRGGEADNVVPGSCTVDIGLRPLPGMTADDLVDRVRGVVGPVLDEVERSITVENESPPMTLPAGHELVRGLIELGDSGPPRTVAFSTDAGWLSRAGFDCVIWGPGSIGVAHKANERVPIDEWERAGEVLHRAIDRWCVRPA